MISTSTSTSMVALTPARTIARCLIGAFGRAMICTEVDFDDCFGGGASPTEAFSPCANGECIDALNGFSCECHEGWTGELCDLAEVHDVDWDDWPQCSSDNHIPTRPGSAWHVVRARSSFTRGNGNHNAFILPLSPSLGNPRYPPCFTIFSPKRLSSVSPLLPKPERTQQLLVACGAAPETPV